MYIDMQHNKKFFSDMSKNYKKCKAIIPDKETEIKYTILAKNGNVGAKDLLYGISIPLIIKKALYYNISPDFFSDLIATSACALDDAIRTFDVSLNCSFQTHLQAHVFNCMQKFMYSNTLIQYPENKIKEIIKNKKQPNYNEECDEFVFSSYETDTVNNMNFSETLEDTSEESVETFAIREEENETLYSKINQLSEIEQKVIKLSFLHNSKKMTVSSIGLALHITPSNVKTIKLNALEKLKTALVEVV